MGRLRERLVSGMTRGLQDFGETVFARSQIDVPVDRGTLKKSGVFRKLPNGFEIAYRAPYAAPVHFGVGAHDERVRRHYVTAHRRRLGGATGYRTVMRKGRYTKRWRYAQVRAHYRGPFTRHVKERAGRPWLQDAMDDLRPQLGRYIGRALARTLGAR